MDLYKEVTDHIISEMEKGIIPWEKPWIASGNCVAHTTGKPYSLLNQIRCSWVALANTSPSTSARRKVAR